MNMIGRQLAVLSPEHNAILDGFRVLNLKFGGKSKKIGGDISPAFRMYGKNM